MSVNIILKENARKILKEKLSMKDLEGEFDNWSHNIKKDYYGLAARNLQAIIQKFARTVSYMVLEPKTRQKLNYLKGDLYYLICELLGEKDISNYFMLLDDEKILDKKDIATTLNGASNISKHNLKESRFYAKSCARLYNSIVERIARKLKVNDILKFKVEEKYIKDINAPTTNYNYLMPIKGEPDYEAKKKREDEMFERFKKTLVVPEDYYIQLKAIKYQRDVVLKEELDDKWNEIRKDRLDHSSEIEYISNSIGDHTFKINYLISQLIYDKINYNKAIALAKVFLREEIERNNKIIDYTKYVIDGVDNHKWKLISSTGTSTTNTKGLINYIKYKTEQNNRLNERLLKVNEIK